MVIEKSGREVRTECVNDVIERIPYQLWEQAQKEVLETNNQGIWQMCLVAIEHLTEFWIAEHEE